MPEVKALRRRVRDLESQLAGGGGALGAANGEAQNDPERVSIDRGVLRTLRAKAQELDQLLDELPRLRYQARRGDELFAEVKSLRYKTANFDALQDELLTLRYKVKQFEKRVSDPPTH
jgi:hypothetical protein